MMNASLLSSASRQVNVNDNNNNNDEEDSQGLLLQSRGCLSLYQLSDRSYEYETDDDWERAPRKNCLLFPMKRPQKQKHYLQQQEQHQTHQQPDYEQPKQKVPLSTSLVNIQRKATASLSWKHKNNKKKQQQSSTQAMDCQQSLQQQQQPEQQPDHQQQLPEASLPMLTNTSRSADADLDMDQLTVNRSSNNSSSSSPRQRQYSKSCFARWNTYSNNTGQNSAMNNNNNNMNKPHHRSRGSSSSFFSTADEEQEEDQAHLMKNSTNDKGEANTMMNHPDTSNVETNDEEGNDDDNTHNSSGLSQQLLLEHIRSEFSTESPPICGQKTPRASLQGSPKTTTYAQFDAQSSAALAIATSEMPYNNTAKNVLDESSSCNSTAALEQRQKQQPRAKDPPGNLSKMGSTVGRLPPLLWTEGSTTATTVKEDEPWDFPPLEDPMWNTESATLQLRTLSLLSPETSSGIVTSDQEMPPPSTAAPFQRSTTEEESLVEGDCPVPWTPQRIQQQRQSLYRNIRRRTPLTENKNGDQQNTSTKTFRQISPPPLAPPIPQQRRTVMNDSTSAKDAPTPFTASILSTRNKICVKTTNDDTEADALDALVASTGASPIQANSSDDANKPDPPLFLPDDSFVAFQDESLSLDQEPASVADGDNHGSNNGEDDKPYNPDDSLLARADEIIQSVKRQIQSDIQAQITPTAATATNTVSSTSKDEGPAQGERILRILPQTVRTAQLISPTTVSSSSKPRYYPSKSSLVPTNPSSRRVLQPIMTNMVATRQHQKSIRVVTPTEVSLLPGMEQRQPFASSFRLGNKNGDEDDEESDIRCYHIPVSTTADDHTVDDMWAEAEVSSLGNDDSMIV